MFANTDWFHYNFNISFAKFLKSKGYEITFIGPKGNYSEKVRDLGIKYEEVPFKRNSINPVHYLRLILWIIKFLKKNKPTVLHNFTLKCIVLGTIASRFNTKDIRVINEITGLGHVYTTISIKNLVIRSLVTQFMKFSIKKEKDRLILLNQSDYDYFKNRIKGDKNSIIKILGVGVNCKQYTPSKETKDNSKFRILLPARLIKEKGVIEFIEAAKALTNENLEFLLAGSIDDGNPTALKLEFIQENIANGVISWLGHVENIRELYKSINLVVLPSYREGLPTSLTEAAACGLPIITTDVPGCKDVVDNLINGIVIPSKSSNALVEAIKILIRDKELCKSFGLASRRRAKELFSEDVIFEKRLALYL